MDRDVDTSISVLLNQESKTLSSVPKIVSKREIMLTQELTKGCKGNFLHYLP